MPTINSLKETNQYTSIIRYKDFVIATEFDMGDYLFYLYQPTPDCWDSLIGSFEELPLVEIPTDNIDFHPTEGEAIATAIAIIEKLN